MKSLRSLDISRRTAEQMRDVIARVFPQLEKVEGERKTGLTSAFREPLAEELTWLMAVAVAGYRQADIAPPNQRYRPGFVIKIGSLEVITEQSRWVGLDHHARCLIHLQSRSFHRRLVC